MAGYVCTRNQYGSGGDLCIVAAWQDYEAHFPHRVTGSERDQPLMRFSDGTPITRERLQHFLAIAAIAGGNDPARVGTHSLRIGGATAMYHVLGDLQMVRRYGRWSSDTFHNYLWESHEPARGLAERMAADESELIAPRGV